MHPKGKEFPWCTHMCDMWLEHFYCIQSITHKFIGPAAVDIFVLQSVISSIVTTALPSNHCHENI